MGILRLSGGRAARAHQSFVAYEEFVSQVRAAGLRSCREYSEWSALKLRPAEIPSRPDMVYRGRGWTSWSSVLAEKRLAERKAVQTDGFDVAPAVLSAWHERRLNFERSRSWFQALVEAECGDEFEFYRLVRSENANLLFRRRDGIADEWAALQVRTASKKKSHYGYYFCKVVAPRAGVGFVGVCEPERKAELVSPSELQAKRSPSKHLFLRELSSTDGGTIPVSERLHGLWTQLPRQRMSSWGRDTLLPGAAACRVRLNRYLSVQAVAFVYWPAGVAAHVGCDDTSGAWNVNVSGLRCVQKTACVNNSMPNSLGRLSRPRRRADGILRRVCYAEHDDVDAFIFFVREGDRLVGLFFLPTEYLLERGYLVDGKGGGKTCVALYPPGRSIKPTNASFAAEQRQFYVDCAGGAITEASATKLKEIVNDIKDRKKKNILAGS